MKTKRVMIYPYDKEFLSLIRYSNRLKEMEITSIISPFGWGINGKDAGTIDHGEAIGIIVKDDFDLGLNECDTVIFSKSIIKLDYEKTLKSKIDKAIENNKNIICLVDLNSDDIKEFKTKCGDKGLNFEYYSNLYNYDNALEEFVDMSNINASVVFVMGLGENTNKFGVQLALREKFLKNGYNVSQIGSRSYSGFLGFHPTPEFMLNNKVAEHEKILLFNKFVKDIEEKEEPDVIIVGIPGGIIPINSRHTNYFGITAFEISRAVTPDATILCTHLNMFNKDYFDNITPLLKYRFGAEVDCFYINNTILDFADQNVWSEVPLIDVLPHKVNEEVKRTQEMGVAIYSSLDDIYMKIEDVLNRYSAINSI